MTQISTHVLDISRGVPAAGVGVELFAAAARTPEQSQDHSPWVSVGAGSTDADGRVAVLTGPDGVRPGLHRLVFSVGDYQRQAGGGSFIEEASLSFTVAAEERLHIPLLLSPYGLSIYRGS